MTSKRTVVIDGYPFRYYRWSDGKYGRREPNYRAVKLFLIEKYGLCYFCAKPVKDYPHKNGVPMHQHDLATIDHLRPRAHGVMPGRRKYEIVEKVLACYKCNHDRNVRYQKGMP